MPLSARRANANEIDATLAALVRDVRSALRDGEADVPSIRTVHGIGYALEP
jgi:DNA-binding response OmpR family regulator